MIKNVHFPGTVDCAPEITGSMKDQYFRFGLMPETTVLPSQLAKEHASGDRIGSFDIGN